MCFSMGIVGIFTVEAHVTVHIVLAYKRTYHSEHINEPILERITLYIIYIYTYFKLK